MPQVKTFKCSVCVQSFQCPLGISAVCSGPAGRPHPATIMSWSTPSVDHARIDYDILAWDVSDAIAKTTDDHGIDLGMDAIKPHLPAFIEACLATQAELDKEVL